MSNTNLPRAPDAQDSLPCTELINQTFQKPCPVLICTQTSKTLQHRSHFLRYVISTVNNCAPKDYQVLTLDGKWTMTGKALTNTLNIACYSG